MSVDAAVPSACRRIQALAERDPRRAVSVGRRALHTLATDDPLMHAWAQYTLGWALLCWERFTMALPHLEEAQALFARQGADLPALRCRHALLLVELWLVDRPGFDAAFAELAREFERWNAPADAARARLDQARQLLVLGQTNDADAVLDQIEPAITAGGALDRARWLRTKGIAANQHGDYARAAALLAQAEQLFTAGRYLPDLARCWFEQARLSQRQEQFDAALEIYQRTEAGYRRLDMPLRLAFCMKNIGLLFARRGRYDDALRATLTALQHFEMLERSSDVADCQLNLGNIYFYTAQWEAAVACYSRAEALYTERGMVGGSLMARRNQAMVYRLQGRRDEAFALLDTLEAQARRLGAQAELAEIWTEQARLWEADGQTAQALALYQQAHDLFQQIGNAAAAAECALEQGWLLLRSGEVAAAAALLHGAAPALEAQPHHGWRVAYGLARCAEAQGQVATALEHYRAALTTVAELRDRLASEEVSSRVYQQAAQLHTDALRLAAACGDAATVLAIGEGQRALVLRRMLTSHLTDLPSAYQSEHERLRNALSQLVSGTAAERAAHASELDVTLAAYSELLLHARYSAVPAEGTTTPSEQPFDVAQVRAALQSAYQDDWTALVYSICDDTLLMSMITADAVALAQTPYDARLRRLIERASLAEYRQYTYRDMPYVLGQTDEPWAGLRALAERLLPAPVRIRLHPNHRLLIVPAGPLHALPWATLRLENGWLAEHAIVQLAPSLTIWQVLANQPSMASGNALLVGCSAFGERVRALPAVADELAAVATHWPGHSTRLLDQAATRAAILERSASGELSGYDLLHFATHGQLLPTRGLAAHLKLWDSDLLLAEVASLKLDARLVSLSACESAAADTLPGEEVVSLSWACLAAGARGVLASLWPIGDAASSQFMGGFYAALNEQRDAGLALAQTQRALLAMDTSNQAVSEPQNWGSFVLTGIGSLG
jgi:tetratricopeptide (TPR) repeat protein